MLQRLSSERELRREGRRERRREGRRKGRREGRRERGVGAESSYHAFLGHLALKLSALELLPPHASTCSGPYKFYGTPLCFSCPGQAGSVQYVINTKHWHQRGCARNRLPQPCLSSRRHRTTNSGPSGLPAGAASPSVCCAHGKVARAVARVLICSVLHPVVQPEL